MVVEWLAWSALGQETPNSNPAAAQLFSEDLVLKDCSAIGKWEKAYASRLKHTWSGCNKIDSIVARIAFCPRL